MLLTRDKIDRINALSKKSKTVGLTEQEKEEQQQLREEYLTSIRQSFKSSLMNVKIVDPEGTDVTPEKLKQEQKRNKH